jgi:hypothetical protein
MIRLLVLTLLLLAAAPATIAEECERWTIAGVRPGMTLKEARAGRNFQRVVDELGDVGYARYMWISPQRTQESVELHIDVESDPPIMFGVTATVPKSKADPQDFVEHLVDRWGSSTSKVTKGPYDLYSWIDKECDIGARVTISSVGGAVGAMAAVISLSRRDEFAERMRAAEQKQQPAETPGED